MGIYAFDRGWQFPAITEQHAYHRMRQMGGAPPGVAYVAYPWATLIDKLQVNAADAQAHLDSFHAFCLGLPEEPVKVTVCQHILLPSFRHLFVEAGVSDVFWSHTTHADLVAAPDPAKGDGLRLHPFPLYPVQTPRIEADRMARTERRWLYSFVGMRPNGWYLTQVRAWIIDRLGADLRGQVIARDDWHYKQIVYRHQVLDRAPKDAQGRPAPGLVDDAASAQFRDVLYDSTFALCPSGTGPNSIRLWEAIMAGSIPVIIADTYAPPGDPRLWDEAVVFCEETADAVAALPDRLAALANDPARMAGLRAGLARLRLLYGPHGFVPDVTALMQSLAHAPDTPTTLTEQGAVRALLTRATALLTGRPALGGAGGPARAALSSAHPARRHYDHVAAGAASDHEHGPAPRIGRGATPALYLAGPGLTPLHYPALRRLAGDRITVVRDPSRADLIMAGSLTDLQTAGSARAVRLIVSEASMPAVGMLPGSGPVWLSHATSDIFRFDRLPYALVCDDQTLPRLAGLLSPERDIPAAALQTRWMAAQARAALWCPPVEAGPYPPDQPAGADPCLHGLAQAVSDAAQARTEGEPQSLLCLEPRQIVPAITPDTSADQVRAALARAHLDKLSRLDGLAPVLGAFEETGHPEHVGMAAIEAIALQARPAGVLGPEHRLREILPAAAMIDLSGLTPVAIAMRLLSEPLDLAAAEAVCEARIALRARLAQPRDVLAERRRIVEAVLQEVFERV
ncbi:Exostosin family protein [Flavimaricola marinus]|uniref:Exostosin family protein n=2 Tax=Flavimaricola marinus TaxID=1819565 RepID=A0A238LI42_9RHOB|nr:Exostosin family protein [Flavimaricola marinus]